MKEMCDFCKRQTGIAGNLRCNAAWYSPNEGYGAHKRGATCIYDDDLSDLFEKRQSEDINVRNMASLIKKQEAETARLRDEILILRERLTKVEV